MPDPASSTLETSTETYSILKMPPLGAFLINPRSEPGEDGYRVNFVVFTRKLGAEDRGLVRKWALGTEAQIFCLKEDVQKFVAEGLSPYRLQALGGFRELSFTGGTLLFYPAQAEKLPGLRGVLSELASNWGLKAEKHYHAVIKPLNGQPIAFLASPHVDSLEWLLVNESRPKHFFYVEGFESSLWSQLSQRVGKAFLPLAEAGNFLGQDTWKADAGLSS